MRLIAILFFIILCTPVFSVENREIAKCAAINGELERLDCYDSLAKSSGLTQPRADPKTSDKTGMWMIDSKTNPIDDTTTETAMLLSTSGKSRWGKPVILFIRCMSDNTDLVVDWGSYLGSSASVLSRIGDSKAITKDWSLSTDKQATFYPKPIPFIKEMMESNKLVLQVTPYNESPITAIFKTEGLKNALKQLRYTCHW